MIMYADARKSTEIRPAVHGHLISQRMAAQLSVLSFRLILLHFDFIMVLFPQGKFFIHVSKLLFFLILSFLKITFCEICLCQEISAAVK